MQFRDIIGQEELKHKLAENVDAGRISHAVLFNGRNGGGALALALAYTQYIHCTCRHDGDSCGQCQSCRQIEALAHPDVNFVFPVNKRNKKSDETVISDNLISEWREIFISTSGYFTEEQWADRMDLGKTLKGIISKSEADQIIRKLSFKSLESDFKTMIIWLPEAMNREAANHLLKILEEPWEKTQFILVSPHPEQLLPTITSRTQEIHVPKLKPEVLEQIVRERGESDEERVRNAARLADGDVIELRHILDSDAGTERTENFEAFKSIMRLSYNDRHLELLEWADEASEFSRDHLLSMLRDFLRLSREAFMMHAGLEQISYLWGEEADFCRKFSPFVTSGNIEAIVRETETAIRQIAQNGDAKIVLSVYALSISKLIRHL